MRVFNVVDLAGGARHQAGEDGALLSHQEGGKRHGKNQSQVLGPVGGEHLQGDKIHK